MLNKPAHLKDWAALRCTNSYICIVPAISWEIRWCNLNGTLLCRFSVKHEIPAQPGFGLDFHFSCWQLFPHWLSSRAKARETRAGIFTLYSFHFRAFALVCFNKDLTECSRLSKESRRGMSNPRSVSGHSVNTLLRLKSAVMESNGLVKAVLTHTHAPNKGWTSGRTKVISALMDVSQWGNVAVQHLSVVKGFPCSACHIQLCSSFLFFFPFGSVLLLT